MSRESGDDELFGSLARHRHAVVLCEELKEGRGYQARQQRKVVSCAHLEQLFELLDREAAKVGGQTRPVNGLLYRDLGEERDLGD
jgi:hypothetical protein